MRFKRPQHEKHSAIPIKLAKSVNSKLINCQVASHDIEDGKHAKCLGCEVVDFEVVPQPKTITAHCGSLVVKTRILSLPEKTLTLKKPRAHRDEHVGDLKRGHRGPTEASQKRTRRTRRSVTWTKGTFPAEMRPVPQTPAAPEDKRKT